MRQKRSSSGWVRLTHRLTKCIFDPIIYGGGTIQTSQTVRNLDAYIDSAIGFTEHVTRLTRKCLFYITQLWSIRRPLTIESSYALVKSLFFTHLDFCDGHQFQRSAEVSRQTVLQATARMILFLRCTVWSARHSIDSNI